VFPQFQSLKYTDFYSKYIHKPLTQAGNINPNQWLEQPSADINVPQIISARVGEDIVSRLIFISPRKGELFYLCALLVHKSVYS
jgi:hypothetical protein